MNPQDVRRWMENLGFKEQDIQEMLSALIKEQKE